MWPNPQFPADLVTFAEKILNGKLYFFWEVKLKYLFCQGSRNEHDKIPQTTIILCNFVNKNAYWFIVFKKCLVKI